MEAPTVAPNLELPPERLDARAGARVIWGFSARL